MHTIFIVAYQPDSGKIKLCQESNKELFPKSNAHSHFQYFGKLENPENKSNLTFIHCSSSYKIIN